MSVWLLNMKEASSRVSSSIYGKPITIGYGLMRIPANLIWMNDPLAWSPSTPDASGGISGKGGVVTTASGGQLPPSDPSTGAFNYTYSIALMFALCEGPASVTPPSGVWFGKSVELFTIAEQSASPSGATSGEFGFTYEDGSFSQTAPTYVQSTHPDQALNYRGTAHVDSFPMYLGTTTSLPSFTFSVYFSINSTLPGIPDASPKLIINDFLTNATYGVGFPAGRLDSWTLYDTYTLANLMVMSPIVDTQQPANTKLQEWMQATNSEFVWSSGVLKIIPYGDTAVSNAFGNSYTPPAFAPYNISDFVLGKGTKQLDDPIVITRKRMEDVNNSVKIEYLDNSQGGNALAYYTPVIVEAKDDSMIDQFGIKSRATQQLYGYTSQGPAMLAAQLLLNREEILNTYEFTVPGKYILLDPMDIVEVTDTTLGMNAFPVRIKEITENDNWTLTIVAEDFPAGAAFSPAFATEPRGGFGANFSADPGNVHVPLIFEPTDPLAGGLFIWMAITGLNLSIWGGCEVWASYDGVNYQKVGVQRGPSRVGVLAGQFAAFAPPAQGQAIDQTNTLSIDLTISGGSVSSGSTADALAFNTLMYIAATGEYVSWRDVTPFGTFQFNLDYLVREGFDTTSMSAAASGTPVCRVDTGIFKIPYTQDRVGKNLFLKFLSFNIYGSKRQNLADVGAVTYTIAGTALTSPLPNVQNFVSSFVGNITYLDWDQVQDFRPVQYEIRKGVAWATAQVFGRFAHPHIPAVGDDTYWIAAVSQPVANLFVYSATPISQVIVGSVLAINLLSQYDEGPTGANWPGTLTDLISVPPFIETPAVSTDLLLAADVLSIDWLGTTGTAIGIYTQPVSHTINNGRLAPCLVYIIFAAVGSGTSDFFNPGPPDNNDVFAHADIFDSAAGQIITSYPEISISTDGVTFGAYQRYQPGFYQMWKMRARMVVQSNDSLNVQAELTQFVVTVYAQTRIDHPLVATNVPSIGETITFAPDGATAAAFTGGPNGGTINPSPGIILPAPSLPGTQTDVTNKQQGDDVIISSLSLSGCTIQVLNGGIGVSRNVTLQVWGF